MTYGFASVLYAGWQSAHAPPIPVQLGIRQPAGYVPTMSRLQSSDSGFPPQAALIGTGIAALAAIASNSVGPAGSALLLEAAAAAFGAASGMAAKRTWAFALIGVVAAAPLAALLFFFVATSVC